jgi:hypothetical protein
MVTGQLGRSPMASSKLGTLISAKLAAIRIGNKVATGKSGPRVCY